jgi:hypothetical protein
MSRSLKSRCNDILTNLEKGAEKNGLRISPINDDLTSGNTLGTPGFDPSTSLRTGKLTTGKISLVYQARRPGCEKEVLSL